MSANFTPDQKGYKTYQSFGTFRLFVLENFPFIAEDFDALTYYQMLCKVVGYLKDVITNNESLQYNQTELLDAFNELQSYVNTYFDNLDVQEEINNKLDEMAESGQLAEIITHYLNLHGMLAFDTKVNMKTSTNLIDGSICKTLGDVSYSDGKGAFYRVRPKQNSDLVDDNNIIALSDNNLIAEKIIYSSNYDLQKQIDQIKSKKIMIVIGDSFSASSQSGTPLWYNYVAKALNLNVYTNASDGQGYGTGANNFLKQLETANSYFTDKNSIDRIYIIGGLNDLNNTSEIPDEFAFSQKVVAVFNYVNNNFPDIPVYVYGILPFQFYNYYSNNTYLSGKRATKFTEMLSYRATQHGMIFTQCSSFGLFLPDYFGSENTSNQRHPSSTGEKAIANLVLTGQRFYGIRNINNNSQTPSLATSIPIVSGTASSVEIIGTDLNYIYLRINGYVNTQDLEINLDNLPININEQTKQYQFPVTDTDTTIFGWKSSARQTFMIPANKLASGTLYLNVPYNPFW